MAYRNFDKFFKELSSSSSTPGGGAAAALTVALGVSLAEMVACINLKRRLDAKGKKRVKIFEKTRSVLIRLIDEDANAFKKLCAFKREERQGPKYEKALRDAALVPMKMCELANSTLHLIWQEKERTSKWLLSDLYESLILLRAGFSAARLNVEINLKDMTDKKVVKKFKQVLNKLSKEIHRNNG